MPPLDWSRIRTRPLAQRRNKVSIREFSPWPPGRGKQAPSPLDLLPDILVGRQWREFVDLTVRAVARRKTVLLMMGGHVVKVGLSPLLITLMEKGAISHVAMNGAAAIHDYEIALIGATSEDVVEYLEDGRFGLWEETGGGMNRILREAVGEVAGPHGSRSRRGTPGTSGPQRAPEGLGFGAAIGRAITKGKFPHKRFSILAAAWRLGIPATVHAAIGAEIIHQHPACSGAAIGEASFRDFKLLTETVARLGKGVVMNWGSAVIMPEVFLKSLAVARNLGARAYGFTSATFDMLRQYRPLVNVVDRPTGKAAGRPRGKGFVFTGHHEILFPLFYASLMNQTRRRTRAA